MKSYRALATAFLAAALSSFLLAACGEDKPEAPAATEEVVVEETVVEPEPAEAAPEPEGELRYSGTTEEGTPYRAQMGGDVVMPENLPADFPIVPGGTLHSAMEAGESAFVTIDYGENSRKIYMDYVEQLRTGGWEVQDQLSLGNVQSLSANGQSHRATIQVQSHGSGSRVSIAFMPRA